ncbi:hypothetical protein [Enterocloster lavalensis]|uniref:hypothetical protein n=1 Tax=Enterocloster lavalensis TaxID=460384 RepID=UPI000D19B01C|nr:hypothetical protein [Enterocloster lavalensis]PST34386.1 hypothetical protein C7256_05280 [Enterocloster lavalensis]
MESLVNEEVKHLKFGRGSILEEPAEHIKVRFQSGGVVKTFRFPDAFAGYLAFEKGELQEKYNEMAMSERRRREEGRREELFKLEEERRAAQTELQKHRRSAARTAKTAAGTAAKNTK